jgi:(4S)-4-hydroxy-5-phosphonooxypentane-2,3-dione isomerase
MRRAGPASRVRKFSIGVDVIGYNHRVSLQVYSDKTEECLSAIHNNARASLRDEPGCLRFDVHRSREDQNRFVLYEIHRDEYAFLQEHRATPHYAEWREAAARCVVEGGHVNTFRTPAFPGDIPEAPNAREAS